MSVSFYASHGRQFSISSIRPVPDRAEVFSFMQSQFRIHEPITSALKCSAQDTFDFYRDICLSCFKDDYSLIARDSQGQLAGIMLSSFWQKDEGGGKKDGTGEERNEFGQAIREGPYQSANANRLSIFIDWVERDFSSLLPSAKRFLKVDILAVHPLFLRMGLASHLLEKTIQMAHSVRCTHLATTATAMASQSLFRKFAFQTARRVPFQAFLEDGIPVYRNLHDSGTGAELMVLEL